MKDFSLYSFRKGNKNLAVIKTAWNSDLNSLQCFRWKIFSLKTCIMNLYSAFGRSVPMEFGFALLDKSQHQQELCTFADLPSISMIFTPQRTRQLYFSWPDQLVKLPNFLYVVLFISEQSEWVDMKVLFNQQHIDFVFRWWKECFGYKNKQWERKWEGCDGYSLQKCRFLNSYFLKGDWIIRILHEIRYNASHSYHFFSYTWRCLMMKE